ncbi:MAG: FAD-dependent oxidoreductase [Chloroflexota bacterium]|nr:FAD-dependent oxidoreductase [Chloroflexota bacterium]
MPVEHDVVIVGAGAAGLTAGLYCANQGLKTVVLERLMPYAQIINAEKIENFPGFPTPPTGGELGARIQEQAMNAGTEFEMSEATGLALKDPYRVVSTVDGDFRAKAVIIAAGSTLRKLGVPGEEELWGRGISQCATCDGPLFQRATVAVVGGGDSAADEALTLTEYCGKVYLLHRSPRLDAQKYLQERIRSAAKIEPVFNTVVERVLGQDTVTGVQLRDVNTKAERTLDLTGVFVFVGIAPSTQFLGGVLKTDEGGHIPVNAWMETAVPGVYAAGDIRQHSSSQLVSAAGDGATAAIAAYRYIAGRRWP